MDKKGLDLFNKLLANLMVMDMKLHHFHWNVQGQNFYEYHALFKRLYENLADYLDELAENVRIHDLKPLTTLKECLILTSLKEGNGSENAHQMIEMTIQDFQMISRDTMEGIDWCKKAEDECSLDLLVSMKRYLDKKCWMLTSMLG